MSIWDKISGKENNLEKAKKNILSNLGNKINEGKEKAMLQYIRGQANMAGYGSMIDKLYAVKKLSEEANLELDYPKALAMVDKCKHMLTELALEYPENAHALKNGFDTLEEQREAILKEKEMKGV